MKFSLTCLEHRSSSHLFQKQRQEIGGNRLIKGRDRGGGGQLRKAHSHRTLSRPTPSRIVWQLLTFVKGTHKPFSTMLVIPTNRKVFLHFQCSPVVRKRKIYSSDFGLDLIALSQSSAVLHNLHAEQFEPFFQLTDVFSHGDQHGRVRYAAAPKVPSCLNNSWMRGPNLRLDLTSEFICCNDYPRDASNERRLNETP